MLMIRTGNNNKLKILVNNFSTNPVKGVSVPILPTFPSSESGSSEIVRLTGNTLKKRRSKKIYSPYGNGNNGNGGGGFPFVATHSTSLIPPLTNPSQEDFVNLFSIYGNILIKEDVKLLCPFNSNVHNEYNYPIDESLMKLFENSTKLWYENSYSGFGSEESRMIPSILSINAPSRSSTWEISKYLAKISGKSHLALIPFSMFYDLIQTCKKTSASGNTNANSFKNVKEAKMFGDFILNNLTKSSASGSASASGYKNTLNFKKNSASFNSGAVIQVIEYLFSCLETAVGGSSDTESNERFTLMIDGLEEFLQTRKGGEEIIMKDLSGWASLFESTGRRLILGGRSQNFIEEEKEDDGGGENNPSGSGFEDEGSSRGGNNNNNNSIITIGNNNKNSGNSGNSPFQVITDLFLKATGSKSSQSSQSDSSLTNVRIEGPIMRLTLSGPKNDKRKLLKYSQLLGIDRKKDLFDMNLSVLKTIAGMRWNLNLSLGLKSKFDFPSEHQQIWEKLSVAGKGILVKRKLGRDEFNEIIMYILGKEGNSTALNCENLCESIDNVSKIRHDPTKFSSDDLTHLFAERQISMSSLSKYEKRFINCISTATTQTEFKDISLPKETIGTLRSLTTLPLTHPELFTQGILKNNLTGVLLFGPPGTGKTMLARAVAQESGAAFLAVNMSNIFDMWVGEGEKNVKGMFSLARKLSPSIIFIDEIDALLERRSSISGRSSRLEIVNEFMSQWDGLSSNLNSGVVVMGATNRPFVLDDAVLRRLPRRLLIDLPDAQSRHEILINLLKENLCEVDLLESLPEMAKRMEFYSGSDLKNVAITAALKSVMRISETGLKNQVLIISKKDFEEAAREVPASLSDQMDSLIELRKWNEMYGETKNIGRQAQKKFGFA